MMFSDIRDVITKRRRRMAYECVLQSHGLTDDQHSYVLQLRNDQLFRLEDLALEKLISHIAKGKCEYIHLLRLPEFLYRSIVQRLVYHGIAGPTLMLHLLQRSMTKLELSTHTHSCVLYSNPVLHRLRSIQLKSLALDNMSSLTDSSLVHIQAIKTLTSLSLAGCRGLSNDLFCRIKGLKHLKSLSVSRIGRVTTAGVSQLSYGEDSALEVLDLSYTSVEERDPHNIFKVISQHPNLHSLDISGITKLSTLYGLKNLQSLKRLSLSRNLLVPLAIEQEIGQLIKLEHLDMEGTEIAGQHISLQYIFSLPLLTFCNLNVKVSEIPLQNIQSRIESLNLTTISLANNSWVDDDVLVELLQPLHGLLELDVSHTRLSSSCLKEQLPSLPNLKVLGLQGVELTDDDMLFLTQLPEIRKLNISDTLLTDTFMTRDYLATCQNLELLSLCRTQISDRGLGSLTLERLQTLWLDGCSVSVEVVLSLSVARCPNLSYVSLRESKPIQDEEEILAAEVLDLLD